VIVVGIDPGTYTGYSEWDLDLKKIQNLKTLNLATAFREILDNRENIAIVVIEDARKRKQFKGKEFDKGRLQGAGSIKAESKIWEMLMIEFEIPYRMTHPSNTKMSAQTFKAATKYKERSSSHARDSAMMIQGLTKTKINLWLSNTLSPAT
jgi:hypothetical protein